MLAWRGDAESGAAWFWTRTADGMRMPVDRWLAGPDEAGRAEGEEDGGAGGAWEGAVGGVRFEADGPEGDVAELGRARDCMVV